MPPRSLSLSLLDVTGETVKCFKRDKNLGVQKQAVEEESPGNSFKAKYLWYSQRETEIVLLFFLKDFNFFI